MTLTDTQKLQAKKHMKVWPNDTLIDASIAALSDGGAKETELVAAIALCETRYSAMNTVVVNSDELTEGGGAKFSHNTALGLRKKWYEDAREDLARLLGVCLDSDNVGTGWRVS